MGKNLKGLIGLVLMAVLSVSCSDNAKVKNLLQQIPANSDVVVVGNVKTVVESAGGTLEDSKIKLPANIADALPKDVMNSLDDVNDLLRVAGIDLEACAAVSNYKDEYPVIVFALDDKDKFIKAIEDYGFKEKSTEGSVAFYTKKVYESSYSDDYDDYGYIAVNGSYVYWIEKVWYGSDFKPVRYLQQMIDEAAEKSFAETNCADYITDGNMGGVAFRWPREMRQEMRENGVPSDMLSLFEGSVCLRGDLSANKCTMDVKLFDENGEEMSVDYFKQFMDVSATISDDALALLGSDEFMIYAASLKGYNWDRYFDIFAGAANLSRSDKAELDAVIGYLKQIDGTAAVGFGFTDGFESIANMSADNDVMGQFSATMVVETKDGKAGRLVEELKAFVEKVADVPLDVTSSGFSVLDRSGNSAVYVKHTGNFVVIANHPIKEKNDNPVVKNVGFSDCLSAMYIGLYKGNKLMEDLGLKDDMRMAFYCKPNTLEMSVSLEIDGDSGTGVLAKVARVVLDIVSKSKELGEKFGRAYDSHDDYDYYDYDTVDVADDDYGYDIDSAAVEDDYMY